MFCSKCGAEMPNNVKFCGKCGNVIKIQSKSNAEKSKIHIQKWFGKLQRLMEEYCACWKNIGQYEQKTKYIWIGEHIGAIVVLCLMIMFISVNERNAVSVSNDAAVAVKKTTTIQEENDEEKKTEETKEEMIESKEVEIKQFLNEAYGYWHVSSDFVKLLKNKINAWPDSKNEVYIAIGGDGMMDYDGMKLKKANFIDAVPLGEKVCCLQSEANKVFFEANGTIEAEFQIEENVMILTIEGEEYQLKKAGVWPTKEQVTNMLFGIDK